MGAMLAMLDVSDLEEGGDIEAVTRGDKLPEWGVDVSAAERSEGVERSGGWSEWREGDDKAT